MANLLNLSDVQKELLTQLKLDYIYTLAAFQFNNPAEDHVLIRQHAALSGKVDLLAQLLDEEKASSMEQQQRMDSLLDSQLGN